MFREEDNRQQLFGARKDSPPKEESRASESPLAARGDEYRLGTSVSEHVKQFMGNLREKGVTQGLGTEHGWQILE